MGISNLLAQYRERVDTYLEACISEQSIDPELQKSMQYSLFNGGKRVRPTLVYMVNAMLGGVPQQADSAAAAIECIHSYSLVHDDLPAMDDDDLRRGKPTCHIAFDEATAILAGDALQCLAFELITSDAQLDNATKVKLIHKLSISAGHQGMVVGQSFDLRNVGKMLSFEQLEAMHQHKTGALLQCSAIMGAITCGKTNAEQLSAISNYAKAIGLAFQVQDDILDIEGNSDVIGKPQGSDLEQNKPTYPALLGLEGAKLLLQQLHTEAVQALKPFGSNARDLIALADFIVQRDH